MVGPIDYTRSQQIPSKEESLEKTRHKFTEAIGLFSQLTSEFLETPSKADQSFALENFSKIIIQLNDLTKDVAQQK